MKMKKRVPWNFLSTDYKAMGEYLENMAEKGWMLEKIGSTFGFATFRKIPPSNIKFYVDVLKDGGNLVPENTSEANEYRSLCEDGGWHYITSQNHLQFFHGNEGENPTPIQTDGDIELRLVKKTILKGEFLTPLLLVFILRNTLYELFFTPYIFFTSIPRMAMGLCLIIFIVNNIVKIIYFLLWMRRSKAQLKNIGQLEKPSLKSARVRAIIFNKTQSITMVLALFFLLSDVNIGPYELIYILLIIGMIFGWVKLLDYIIKKKGKRKDDGFFYALVWFPIMIGFFALFLHLTWGIFMERDYQEEIIIPEDYPIVDVEELSATKQREEPWYGFTSDSSYFIPLSYRLKGDISGNYLGIYYHRSRDDSFSKLVFKGKVRELKRYFKQFRLYTIDVEKLKEDEELRKKWQADELIMGKREHDIVIRKGRHVLWLQCFGLDFYDESLIEYISNIYFVD